MENIYLSDSSAHYIIHVKAKTGEAKKELDISKLKKILKNEETGSYDFTEHACTGMEFQNTSETHGEMTGASGSIHLLTDISENGDWYIMDVSQKENTAGYSGIKITAWAKWKNSTEKAEFDIPIENMQKSLSVPASCAQLTIKNCFVNSIGITAEAEGRNDNGIETSPKSVTFKVNMKDGSVKTYDNCGWLCNNENLTLTCLFNVPVKASDITDVEIRTK